MTLKTGPLRLYTDDLEFFSGYIEKLVEEARTGLPEALRRMRDHVPRFRGVTNGAVIAGEPAVADAQQVFAAEHAFGDWAAMVDYARQISAGKREDPYIDFIHKVEGGDTPAVGDHLDRDPSLVNEIASTHNAPLHSAGNKEVAALLLERGADAELETPLSGGTALMHALIWGWADVAVVIAAHSVYPSNLRVAAGLGDSAMLDSMWAERGQLTAEARDKRDYYRPNHGWFPWEPGDSDQEILDEALIFAAISGRIEAADRLLERGASIDGRAYNTTALLRTAWRGRIPMVDWLLDHGADIHGTGWLGGHAKGVTALHLAAGNGDMAMIEYLLDRGADPTLTDELYDGRPEGWANNFGHDEAERFLASVSRA
jgi:hypothetical protein